MKQDNNIIRCERCGEKLDPQKAKWLELSQTDGNYYAELPEGHESQGRFSFGSSCAKTEIRQTNESLFRIKWNKEVGAKVDGMVISSLKY